MVNDKAKIERIIERLESKNNATDKNSLIFLYGLLFKKECSNFEEVKRHKFWDRYYQLNVELNMGISKSVGGGCGE